MVPDPFPDVRRLRDILRCALSLRARRSCVHFRRHFRYHPGGQVPLAAVARPFPAFGSPSFGGPPVQSIVLGAGFRFVLASLVFVPKYGILHGASAVSSEFGTRHAFRFFPQGGVRSLFRRRSGPFFSLDRATFASPKTRRLPQLFIVSSLKRAPQAFKPITIGQLRTSAHRRGRALPQKPAAQGASGDGVAPTFTTFVSLDVSSFSLRVSVNRKILGSPLTERDAQGPTAAYVFEVSDILLVR